MTLPSIICPKCKRSVSPINGIRIKTSSYDDCLRICNICKIGFSNAKNNPTVIYKNYLENIPELLQQNLVFTLRNSINEFNRKNKLNKFGFSSSEDALTWSFFNYFVVNNKFEDLLDILNIESDKTNYDIYLWGTKINSLNEQTNFIDQFKEVSNSFNEMPSRRTEPDVILKFSNKLIFIEVKYLSSNAITKEENKFTKYLISDVNQKELIESGHYELYRNWAFASKLSNGDNFELINLGRKILFNDKNQKNLLQFENSLKSSKGKFVKLNWEDILEKVNSKDYESWFKDYLNNKFSINR